MPVKGIERVRMNTKKKLEEIAGPVTERVLTEVLIIGSGYASTMTPVDTSTLINSQYRRLEPTSGGKRGVVGYTAGYAAFVHGASGKLKGLARPGGRGKYWDPKGEPEFLKKGFERDGLAAIKAAIKRGYKV